jgi:hypothetical protein
VKTSSFRTYTGPGRVSIARYAPRNHPAGYRVCSKLAPGPWFNRVTYERYCELYGAILDKLDPRRIYAELVELAAPGEPVLLCWEVPPFSIPHNWCHRRLLADWFKTTIDVDVPELVLPGRQPGLNLPQPAVPKGPPTHVIPRPGVEPDVPVVPQSWLDSRKK